MTKARNISDLLDANGDVKSGALDNVPPSNDASALTTGTIDNARISLDANEIPNLDTAKITTGTFADARIPNLDTSKITTGTFADARMPSTVLNSNVDLTNLSASNLTSGTLPDARFPSTLPAISGANLTNLPAGGKVLQVVSATDETIRSSSATSSSGYITMSNTLTVNITPSSTSSKIITWVATGVRQVNREWQFTIFRDGTSGTDLGQSSHGLFYCELTGGMQMNLMVIDSPNTTSQKSYGLFAKNQTNLGDSTCHINTSRDGSKAIRGYIIAMEIGA